MNKVEEIYCHLWRYRLCRVNGVGGNGDGGVGGGGGGACACRCTHISLSSCPLLR